MRHRSYQRIRQYEHHPGLSVGIFFIVLGVALLIATNDVFHLGSTASYFNWKTALIFIGVLLLLNLRFIGGVLCLAAGIWFLKDQLFPFVTDSFNIFYWPAVIGFLGLSLILSSLFRVRK